MSQDMRGKSYLRLSSILFDPNYYAMICGFAILYPLFICQQRTLKYLALILCMISLYFTYSKGAILALMIAITWNLLKHRIYLLLFGLVLLFFSFDYIYESILEIDLLWLQMGLNKRDIYWQHAIEKISEQYLLGYG